MADGKVITGYSKPYVALYDENNGDPAYSDGTALARGVDVNTSIDDGNSLDFHINGVLAESDDILFTGGDVTFTIDGLKKAARALISGTKTRETITVGSGENARSVVITDNDEDEETPYVGVAFIIRYMEDGVNSYMPVFFPKLQFKNDDISAMTQGEYIEYQTSQLSARIFYDDSAKHRWRRIADDQESEEDAEKVVKAFLNIQDEYHNICVFCLSGDTKPITGMLENSILLELDTMEIYYYHNRNWYLFGRGGI